MASSRKISWKHILLAVVIILVILFVFTDFFVSKYYSEDRKVSCDCFGISTGTSSDGISSYAYCFGIKYNCLKTDEGFFYNYKPEDCSKLDANFRNECIRQVAYVLEKPDMCYYQIYVYSSGYYWDSTCLQRIAEKTSNLSLCFSIDPNICMRNKIWEGKKSLDIMCPNGIEKCLPNATLRKRFLSAFASDMNDINLCMNDTNSSIKDNCISGFLESAFYSKGKKYTIKADLCDAVTGTDIRNRCFTVVAFLQKDETYCTKLVGTQTYAENQDMMNYCLGLAKRDASYCLKMTYYHGLSDQCIEFINS